MLQPKQFINSGEMDSEIDHILADANRLFGDMLESSNNFDNNYLTESDEKFEQLSDIIANYRVSLRQVDRNYYE